jgi:hypothetical protein
VPRHSGPLGRWCNRQQQDYKKGKLSPERIAQLEAIGFCWDLKTAAWEQKLAELLAYKKINGHCNVPQSKVPLGAWCGTQRQDRKKGRLSSERIAQLDALGFCWQPRFPNRTEIEHGIFPSRFGEPC